MPEPPRLAGPRDVFERQLRLIEQDDRDAQLALYAEDCVWEFPFAPTDRPRRMLGRAEIARVMLPMWEAARQAGVQVVGHDSVIHETIDPEVIVAEFQLDVQVRATGRDRRLSFVQVLRVRAGRIVELREYFNPLARADLFDEKPA
jgi:uncharacterized protein